LKCALPKSFSQSSALNIMSVFWNSTNSGEIGQFSKTLILVTQ
jgi:hypothetical protein